MGTQIQKASRRLFGEGGMRATNIKIFRGFGSNVTAEDIAREINRSLDQLQAGDFEIADMDSMDD